MRVDFFLHAYDGGADAITGGGDPPKMREIQRRYARAVLDLMDGNKTHAEKVLGVDRRSVYRLIA